MTGHNKTGRSRKGPPFAQLFHHVLDSEAWLTSKPLDRALLVQLARRYNSSNNGRIALSVRDAAAECCADKDACAAAFHRVEERGLIECVADSAFSFKLKRAREWRLTWLRCDVTHAPPSRAYQKWGVRNNGTAARHHGLGAKQIDGPERPLSGSPQDGQTGLDQRVLVPTVGTKLGIPSCLPVPSIGTHIDLSHRLSANDAALAVVSSFTCASSETENPSTVDPYEDDASAFW